MHQHRSSNTEGDGTISISAMVTSSDIYCRCSLSEPFEKVAGLILYYLQVGDSFEVPFYAMEKSTDSGSA